MKLLLILVCKGTCAPVTPLSKSSGVQCPRNAPPFRRPWQGLSTWGTCTHMGTFAYLKGTFNTSSRRE